MKAAIKKTVKGEQSEFGQLVDEALTLYRELHAAQFGDARDEKLSASAYLKEALVNARTDLPTIKKLDRLVQGLPAAGYPNLLRFVGQVTQQAAATHPSQGVNLRPVTGNLHWFVGHDQQAFTGVLVEAMTIGANVLQLVALAAYRATRDSPENFGSIEDWDEHAGWRSAKEAQLEGLYAQIAEAWQGAPIEWDGTNPRVRFGDITLPVAPPETLGERLCAQLM